MDKLSEIFDVQPLSQQTQEILPAQTMQPTVAVDSTLDNDYETTRHNLMMLLNQGQEALTHAIAVAKNSEHPRAFEVVSGLMKDLSDINLKLMELHKRKQSMIHAEKKLDISSGKNVTNNNAIFVGSTADFSKMINDLRKGK